MLVLQRGKQLAQRMRVVDPAVASDLGNVGKHIVGARFALELRVDRPVFQQRVLTLRQFAQGALHVLDHAFLEPVEQLGQFIQFYRLRRSRLLFERVDAGRE